MMGEKEGLITLSHVHRESSHPAQCGLKGWRAKSDWAGLTPNKEISSPKPLNKDIKGYKGIKGLDN